MTSILVGASGLHAFFGAGGPYFNPDGSLAAGAGSAIGLALSNVTFGLALMKSVPTQSVPNPTRSFLALEASGSVQLKGVTGVTFIANDVAIEVNQSSDSQATGPVPTVNLTATPVLVPTDANPADDVDLNFASGPIFAAQGAVSLTLGSFVSVSGNFAFQQGTTQSVTLSDGSTKNLSILEVGASNVYAFVGLGGPYFNPDGTLAAGSSSAVGVALKNLSFGLALLKDATSGTSYYALAATASSIALVGVPDVTISAQSLSLTVNGTGAAGGAPVVNFLTSFPGGGLVIPTGPGTRAPPINFASATLAASGTVSFGFSFGSQVLSVGASATFEKTTDSAGHTVIEVGVSNLGVTLGNPAIISLSGLSGALVITDRRTGRRAERPRSRSTSAASPQLSGTLRLSFNNTNQPVDETFGAPDFTPGQVPAGGTYELKLPAGPYVAIGGDSVMLTIKGVVLTGTFELEQVALPAANGQPAETVVRVAATGVSLSYSDSHYGSVSLRNGSGGLVILPGGIAASLSVQFNGSIPAGVSASAGVTLAINTTSTPINETISLDNGSRVTINVAANAFNLFLTNASFSIDNIVTVNVQDFTVQSSVVGQYTVTLYGAKNVMLFIGQGSADSPGVGVEVDAAELGIVKYANNTNPSDVSYAVYAYGTASLVGVPGLTVSGSLQVLYNKTGRTINQTIQVDPTDPSQTISVVYNSTSFVEEFSAGVDANGQHDANSLLTIQASKVLTLVRLARAAHRERRSGGAHRLCADGDRSGDHHPGQQHGNFSTTPTVSSLRHGLEFSIGGGQGFQLQELRVNGFSIFGVGATISAPAPASLPPTADIESPLPGQSISVDTLNQQGYIQVQFNDVDHVGLNVASITSGTAKLKLLGADAAGVTILGPGVQVNPNDDTTFRFAFAGQFVATAPDSTIGVEFLPGTFSDTAGDQNAASIEQFTVTTGGAQGSQAAP